MSKNEDLKLITDNYICIYKENHDWHMESDTYDNIRIKIPPTVKNIKDGRIHYVSKAGSAFDQINSTLVVGWYDNSCFSVVTVMNIF